SCGSDSSSDTYADVGSRYNAEYIGHNLRNSGSRAALIESMSTNLDWFGAFPVPSKRFLDVGCNEGCAIEEMSRRGWDAWGFDVNQAAEGIQVRIAERLDGSLFDERFGAIMCREV